MLVTVTVTQNYNCGQITWDLPILEAGKKQSKPTFVVLKITRNSKYSMA